jgi:predicted ATPase
MFGEFKNQVLETNRTQGSTDLPWAHKHIATQWISRKAAKKQRNPPKLFLDFTGWPEALSPPAL